jgi:hypothetical protein
MPPEQPEGEREARQQFNLQFQFTAAAGDVRLHLMYIRTIERMRRAVAREYGLPLSSLSLTQSFISRLRCYDIPQHTHYAGPVHVDECSTARCTHARMHTHTHTLSLSLSLSLSLYLSLSLSLSLSSTFTRPPARTHAQRVLAHTRILNSTFWSPRTLLALRREEERGEEGGR